MCSQLAGAGEFFLRVDDLRLSCLTCGNRTRITDKPYARGEAEAAHTCGLACGCWSAELHAATGEGDCADG